MKIERTTGNGWKTKLLLGLITFVFLPLLAWLATSLRASDMERLVGHDQAADSVLGVHSHRLDILERGAIRQEERIEQSMRLQIAMAKKLNVSEYEIELAKMSLIDTTAHVGTSVSGRGNDPSVIYVRVPFNGQSFAWIHGDTIFIPWQDSTLREP
jgi:hypothetical protein